MSDFNECAAHIEDDHLNFVSCLTLERLLDGISSAERRSCERCRRKQLDMKKQVWCLSRHFVLRFVTIGSCAQWSS
eukprot:5667135-Amphidinium_carterae.1